MKAPPPPSPVAKRARVSPFVFLLVLFLLLFSFLYGEDLKELLGSQAQARPSLHFNAAAAGDGIELPAATAATTGNVTTHAWCISSQLIASSNLF